MSRIQRRAITADLCRNSTTRCLRDSAPVQSSSGVSGDRVVEMRPKLAWRLGCPAIVVLLATGVDLTNWRKLLVVGAFLALSFLPFRMFIRIEDGVLYQRGVWRWYPPLDLDRLHTVRMSGWTSRFPHRELALGSDDGETRSVSPVWWSNWRPLVTMIAKSARSSSAGNPPHGGWKLALDSKTDRYLSEFL